MEIVNVTQARADLYQLIDSINESHEPVLITGKRGNAVLLSQEDWDAISETLYLNANPALRTSLEEGIKTPLAECSTALDW